MPSREPRVQDSAIDGQEMPRIFTPILPLLSGRCDSHPNLGPSRVGSGAAGRWPLPMAAVAGAKWPRIQRIPAFPLDMTSLDANDGSLAPFERELRKAEEPCRPHY